MMSNIKRQLTRLGLSKILRRHYAIIIVSFLLSWTYMGTTLTACRTTLIGGGGDHLNGIIWMFTFTSHPYGGLSAVTNFPFGESVAQPQLITSALHMVPAWIISKAFGPFCGWNLMVLAGYMLSALTMYGFIYWLLRHRAIALFAAIATAFSPYHYFKTWGHLSYIHSELFIAILWAYLAFWREPSKNKAILVGLLTSCLLYGDGYFPLIGGVLVSVMVIYSLAVGFIASRNNKSEYKKYVHKVKYLLVSLAVIFIAALPVLYVGSHYKSSIGSSLAGTRSSESVEVERYGARPLDFILPSVTSPIGFFSKWSSYQRNHHSYSNPGEYTLFLGFTVMTLSVFAAGFGLKEFLNRNNLKENERWLVWVAGACISVALVAIATSFAPSVRIFGFHPIWPSEIISSLTSLWRVFARIYLVIAVAMVAAASIGLWWLTRMVDSRRIRALIIALAIVLTLIEMMPVNPFSRTDEWSIKNASPTYWWLRDHKDIKAIAAYPMLEQPFDSSYFGDQVIHQKALVNSDLTSDPQLLLHRALTGIEDPQTLGVLKTLGANDLLLYQVTLPLNDNHLSMLYGNFGARVAQITPDVVALNHALVPDIGFDIPVVNTVTQTSCRHQLGPIGGLSVRRLAGSANTSVPVHFDLKGQPGQFVVVYGGGSTLSSHQFTQTNELYPVDFAISDTSSVSIHYVSDPSAGFADVCDLGVGE